MIWQLPGKSKTLKASTHITTIPTIFQSFKTSFSIFKFTYLERSVVNMLKKVVPDQPWRNLNQLIHKKFIKLSHAFLFLVFSIEYVKRNLFIVRIWKLSFTIPLLNNSKKFSRSSWVSRELNNKRIFPTFYSCRNKLDSFFTVVVCLSLRKQPFYWIKFISSWKHRTEV